MCCVLLIFFFVHCGCDRGLIASAIIIVEVILYLTIAELVRSGESQEYSLGIEISTWYQSHGGHGATEVRCEHNCILAGLTSSWVRTLVLKTSGIFKNSNSRTLDKGRVRTSLEFLQANTLAGCELHWNSCRQMH
jgi:hypothetical protein